MLLDQWHLGLDGKGDVLQRCRRASIERDPGQNPGAALLIHETARTVDRVDDHAPDGIRLVGAAGQDDLSAVRQPFGNQHQRRQRCDVGLERQNQFLFADAVNRIDRVAFFVVRDLRKLVDRRRLSRGDHGVAHSIVDIQDRLDQGVYVGHCGSSTIDIVAGDCGKSPAT